MKHPHVFKQWWLLLSAAQPRTSLSKGRKQLRLKTKTPHTNSVPCAAASWVSQQASTEKAARVWRSILSFPSQNWGLVVIQFQSTMQGNGLEMWICPSRAVTELYLLFNSYVVFTSKAAWLAAAAHALRTVKHSQVPVSTTAFWKFTSIVPSFMFHLNYPFTDVWLKQLFENAVSTTTDRVNSILLWCAGNQKAFK